MNEPLEVQYRVLQYYETPRSLRIIPSIIIALYYNMLALSWTPVALRLTDACTYAAELSDH